MTLIFCQEYFFDETFFLHKLIFVNVYQNKARKSDSHLLKKNES